MATSKWIFLTLLLLISSPVFSQQYQIPAESYTLSESGAWCWFADPRALYHKSSEGHFERTWVGYIDPRGNIKALQHDHLTGFSEEVLIRSWFQPDDHNNPTFLVLPDERVMILYSRHTDEACFYYRISKQAGDITTLGPEKKIVANHNTTYPSAFLMSDDPEHIYLAWRGLNWHPTLAKLALPNENDEVVITEGPWQLVSYAGRGSRPYAKYNSNGKDQIMMTYTTTHPDNQEVNYVYYSSIDINTLQLKDINGRVIQDITEAPHSIKADSSYLQNHPAMVVDPSPARNWIWQVVPDSNGKPVIATVRISADKTQHDYYRAWWDGEKWQNTFLANAGGHFHQSPDIELCYSGGMTIHPDHPELIYASVPISGNHGEVYEIIEYRCNAEGQITTRAITNNSKENNVRPYYIKGSNEATGTLTWMHGQYFDWIVSRDRPQGYPTAIYANRPLQQAKPQPDNIRTSHLKNFPHSLKRKQKNRDFKLQMQVTANPASPEALLLATNAFSYGIDAKGRPWLKVGDTVYPSNNIAGTSDQWKHEARSTNGKWYPPVLHEQFDLSISYQNGVLTTHINGLIDQRTAVPDLKLREIKVSNTALKFQLL